MTRRALLAAKDATAADAVGSSSSRQAHRATPRACVCRTRLPMQSAHLRVLLTRRRGSGAVAVVVNHSTTPTRPRSRTGARAARQRAPPDTAVHHPVLVRPRTRGHGSSGSRRVPSESPPVASQPSSHQPSSHQQSSHQQSSHQQSDLLLAAIEARNGRAGRQAAPLVSRHFDLDALIGEASAADRNPLRIWEEPSFSLARRPLGRPRRSDCNATRATADGALRLDGDVCR